MERLTERKFGRYRLKSTCRLDTLQGARSVVDRLAAYEDSGLEPEEVTDLMASHGTAIGQLTEYRNLAPLKHLRELVKAEKEGRLVEQKMNPGTEVWVVNRDEYGEPYDVSGYMFLAEVSGFVILTAYINDLESLASTMEYHAEETSENYVTDLAVFPAGDCYLTREQAEAALKGENHETDTV